MNESILNDSKKLLVNYLQGKTIDYEIYHPWRKDWESIVLHSNRVEGYVKRILSFERHDLSPNEILIIRLAAVLHDIGRCNQNEGHAILGRDIVHNWLRNNPDILKATGDKDKLLYLIEKHSSKEESIDDYSLKILKDADALDEIGAMSIFMASNWIDRSSPYFFNLLLHRLEREEINYCKKTLEILNTESAKQILLNKIKFISLFANQLKDELYGTEIFGQVNIQDYFDYVP